jgi:hypothetical protein
LIQAIVRSTASVEWFAAIKTTFAARFGGLDGLAIH